MSTKLGTVDMDDWIRVRSDHKSNRYGHQVEASGALE